MALAPPPLRATSHPAWRCGAWAPVRFPRAPRFSPDQHAAGPRRESRPRRRKVRRRPPGPLQQIGRAHVWTPVTL